MMFISVYILCVYTMNHPGFIISNQKEGSISAYKVNTSLKSAEVVQ